MKALERSTTIGSFRAVRMDKAGKVVDGTSTGTRSDAQSWARRYAQDNPGCIAEVVEVDQAFRAGVVVMEIEEMK